ncbi:hypothetical protein AAVH_08101 [Aphelenchoides avenae]|nr:hypothetical protein AAVH_08101 [Aphelenchus avenae]
MFTVRGNPLSKLTTDAVECGPLERLERCHICRQPSCKRPLIPNRRCPIGCSKPGCACIEGFVRDDRLDGDTGSCIRPVDCIA